MTRSFTRSKLLTLVLAGAALAIVSPTAAFAATISVTTTADVMSNDGQCSLREAITAANTDTAPFTGAGECAAGNGADTIVLRAGTYALSIPGAGEDLNLTGDLDVRGPTTLIGAGAAITTIDANHIDRVIHVQIGATATIEGVTITDGLAPSGANGASRTGANNSRATGDAGGAGALGGGVLNEGTLSIVDSVITRNSAGAGGLGGNGTGGAGDSGQDGARAGDGYGGNGGPGGSGGGVFSGGIALTLTRTIVSDNAAGAGGGGGTGTGGEGGVAITGIAGDGGIGQGGDGAPGGGGGGVGQRGGGTVTLEQSSISGNTAGVGGPGGPGSGGIGGGSGGDASGHGGEGVGGNGGSGGDGGGIQAAGTVITTDDEVSGNAAGAGGVAGDGLGEKGGNDSGTNGLASRGGRGQGGEGGVGGAAGGIEAGSISAVNDTVTANASGAGAAGGNGTGGPGGNILTSGSNGSGGNGIGGTGGTGGAAGGLRLDTDPSTLRHVTIASNGAGEGGRPGGAHGGARGTGGTDGVPGSANPGVTGGAGGDGAIVAVPPTTLQNTILAGNSTPGCDGTFIDGGHDIAFPDRTCPGAMVDPRLGPLADNGGPTETEALGPGSPALDAVPATGAGCAATDQRGVSRPQGGGCDIGAYEHSPPGVVTGTATGISIIAATLGGQLNPNARPTSYHFEYGTTTSYGLSTVSQHAAPGVALVAVSAAVSGLARASTYHYRLVASNADGTAFGSDQMFTTTGAGPGGAGSGAPRFLFASVRPSVFAAERGGTGGERGGRAGKRGRRRPPLGTTFRYSLSEPARVLFTIEQILPGRRVGSACVAQTAHNRKHRACRRLAKPRRFTVNAVGGSNITRFTGRIGNQALAPGRYRVTLVATNATGGRSAPKQLTFRVVLG